MLCLPDSTPGPFVKRNDKNQAPQPLLWFLVLRGRGLGRYGATGVLEGCLGGTRVGRGDAGTGNHKKKFGERYRRAGTQDVKLTAGPKQFRWPVCAKSQAKFGERYRAAGPGGLRAGAFSSDIEAQNFMSLQKVAKKKYERYLRAGCDNIAKQLSRGVHIGTRSRLLRLRLRNF